MVIDFHTHCFSESVSDAAIALLETRSGIPTNGSDTPENLKAAMRRHGVDISVVLPVATKASHVPVINRWALEQMCDSLVFFGAVHPEGPDFTAGLQWLKQHGFKGVKLHPDYIGYFADDKRLFPLYEAIRDTGLTLVLHTGLDNVYSYPVHSTPLMIHKVLNLFPGLTLVIPHMGGHALWRDAEDLLLGKPLFIDTCYSQYALSKLDMVRMIGKHGAENVLFGTDSPWKNASEEISMLRELPLPSNDIDKILYKNALYLLGKAVN